MPFLELSLALKVLVIWPDVGHCHLGRAMPVPELEVRDGLLLALACGCFSAVVVVSVGRLSTALLLVVADGLLGIAVPPVLGFAVALVFGFADEEA